MMRSYVFWVVGTAVMYAVLLERACRTRLTSMSAGGPEAWMPH
ncbi:hypothetical protein ACFV24_26560 [Nocardia fluminea]